MLHKFFFFFYSIDSFFFFSDSQKKKEEKKITTNRNGCAIIWTTMNWFTVSKTRSFVSHKQNKPCRYLLSMMLNSLAEKVKKDENLFTM